MGRRRCKVVHNGGSFSGSNGNSNHPMHTHIYKIVQGNAICTLRLNTSGPICVDGKFDVLMVKK